jgi:hypothetical protein
MAEISLLLSLYIMLCEKTTNPTTDWWRRLRGLWGVLLLFFFLPFVAENKITETNNYHHYAKT